MKEIETSSWITAGKITMVGGILNIREETSIEKLAMAYANVINSTDRLLASYDELGITQFLSPKVDGYTKEEWKQDIILRIKIIQQKDTLDALKSVKSEWEELMDKEDRKALVQKKMNDILQKL